MRANDICILDDTRSRICCTKADFSIPEIRGQQARFLDKYLNLPIDNRTRP